MQEAPTKGSFLGPGEAWYPLTQVGVAALPILEASGSGRENDFNLGGRTTNRHSQGHTKTKVIKRKYPG